MQSVELFVVLLGGTLDHYLLIVKRFLHEGKVLEELNAFLLLLREVCLLDLLIKLIWQHAWILPELLAPHFVVLN